MRAGLEEPVVRPVGPSVTSFAAPEKRVAVGPPPLTPLDRLRGASDALRSYRPPRRLLIAAVTIMLMGLGAVAVFGSGAATGTATKTRQRIDSQLPLTKGPAVSSPPVVAASSTLGAVGTTTAPVRMVVHAAGALVSPGVYLMNAGSRLADVVSAAGGMAPDADGDAVNLAAPVADGQRAYIPHQGKPVPSVVTAEPVIAAGGGAVDVPGPVVAAPPVDLNTASAEQLDTLPGVGPATAAAIIEHRTQAGRFTSVTQLLDVPGIGEAKLAAMRKRVTVSR